MAEQNIAAALSDLEGAKEKRCLAKAAFEVANEKEWLAWGALAEVLEQALKASALAVAANTAFGDACNAEQSAGWRFDAAVADAGWPDRYVNLGDLPF